MKKLTPEQFLRHIRNLGSKFDAELFRAKREIGEYTLNHFKSSFDRQGFAGGGGKWQERKHSYDHPILNKSGSMKDKMNFRVFNTADKIVVSSMRPYSQFHNDPTGTWRTNQHSSSPQIQRQFMGNSKALERWIEKRLKKALTHTFRY